MSESVLAERERIFCEESAVVVGEGMEMEYSHSVDAYTKQDTADLE